MLRYWSLAVRLKNRQVPAVEAIIDPVLLAYLMIDELILCNAVVSITPPKHMAQIINQMVFSIPYIPPVDGKSFMMEFGDFIFTSFPMALNTAM